MRKHTMSNCPVENALKLIGGKWKIPIIHHLSKKIKIWSNQKGFKSDYSTNALQAIERNGSRWIDY